MKRILILGIYLPILFYSFNLYGQSTTKNLTPKNQRFGFFAGYVGEQVINPGFQIGMEYYLATTPNFQVLSSFHYAFFSQADVYQAHLLTPRVGFRYTADFGLTLGSFLGLGYLFRRFEYDQYKLNAQGDLVNVGRAGVSSMVPNVTAELGYDLSRVSDLDVKLYIRPGFQFYYPNGFVTFDATYFAEIGLIYVPTFK